MSMRRSALFFLVVALAFTSVVKADDADDEDEDLGVQGVEIKTIFPDSENQAVPNIKAGEATKALVTFENNAESTFQVEFMTASLASAHNPGQIIQNLTGTLVNRTVNQGESVSMLYSFTPFKDIDPVEYGLAISVYFMSEENERMMLAGFNETVTVQDSSSVFDVQSLFMFVLIGGAIYFGMQHFNKKAAKVVKRSAVSASPAPADAPDTYIPKEHLRAVQRKSSPNRKKSPQ
eukprot:TRINITY_DN140_c0_g1_i1.p2 TRINITY_DN140_c0_g1~~TRINITY_DN140_c0_g1_i1.p2  ORF type:complete len:234 (+),score=134.39 TRINITY_DN140_c0_g1_i1:70-771(+)